VETPAANVCHSKAFAYDSVVISRENSWVNPLQSIVCFVNFMLISLRFGTRMAAWTF
jgi:hypothetical protein